MDSCCTILVNKGIECMALLEPDENRIEKSSCEKTGVM